MEGAFAIADHLCQIKGMVLVLEPAELPGGELSQEQPWFLVGTPLPAQQTDSSPGNGRWEEEKRTDLFHEINGVTLDVNSLFTNISSSVVHLARETASYPQLCPMWFPPPFVSDSQRRALL